MHAPMMNRIAAVSLGVTLLSAPLAYAAEGRGGPESRQHMRGQGASDEEMKSRRAEMRAMMEQRQRKLDELAAAMNQATGQEKVDAIAALLNELVSQRKAMQQRMGERMAKPKGSGGEPGSEGGSEAPGMSR